MYKIKKEVAEKLRNKYIVDNLELSSVYVSELLNNKRNCPKYMAVAIASIYDMDIEKIFEKVGK